MALLAYAEHVFVHCLSLTSVLRVIQIVCELNILIPACLTVKCGIKRGIKWKVLSVANKLVIIKKVDTQLHVT